MIVDDLGGPSSHEPQSLTAVKHDERGKTRGRLNGVKRVKLTHEVMDKARSPPMHRHARNLTRPASSYGQMCRTPITTEPDDAQDRATNTRGTRAGRSQPRAGCAAMSRIRTCPKKERRAKASLGEGGWELQQRRRLLGVLGSSARFFGPRRKVALWRRARLQCHWPNRLLTMTPHDSG